MKTPHWDQQHRCPVCNKLFFPNSGRQKYCGAQCRYTVWYSRRVKHKKPRLVMRCELPGCGAVILRKWATRYCCHAHQVLSRRIKNLKYARDNGYLTPQQTRDAIAKLYQRGRREKEIKPKPKRWRLNSQHCHYDTNRQRQLKKEA